ncbi:MAG: NAD(P)/FAD-dependent oxidoreductase [Defluviitaleaceae bacterium]|nr:NAD(P)/FAD-dependent oxidoreductase [Defluviitaleaceae bacterium]
MTDTIIIGGGPAGVSAALYTARAGMKTLIIHKGGGALDKAERVENFYGSPGTTGPALLETGLTHAADMGAELASGEVVKIQRDVQDGHFTVQTTSESYTARTLLLATGASRLAPAIPGLSTYEGKGISHCAICDAFFYKGKDVAVLGSGPYALSEANQLLPLVKSLTLLTNGEEPSTQLPPEINIRKEKIQEIIGESRLTAVALEPDGEHIPLNGLFIAMGVAGATELARKAGAFVENNAVIVDKNMQTGVPGLWAAGDCTGGMKQIAKAVYEGAIAGTDIVIYLRGATISNENS